MHKSKNASSGHSAPNAIIFKRLQCIRPVVARQRHTHAPVPLYATLIPPFTNHMVPRCFFLSVTPSSTGATTCCNSTRSFVAVFGNASGVVLVLCSSPIFGVFGVFPLCFCVFEEKVSSACRYRCCKMVIW